MITQIRGRLVEKSPTELVVDCNGIGYSINISLNTFSKLSDEENIKLFTHLIIKEDSHSLFGFLTICICIKYTSPRPRAGLLSRKPSSARKKK